MDPDQFRPGVKQVDLVLTGGQRAYGGVLSVSEWGEPTVEILTRRHIPISDIRECIFVYSVDP